MRRDKMCASLYTAYRENRLCSAPIIRKTAQKDVSLSIGKAVMADRVEIFTGKCKKTNDKSPGFQMETGDYFVTVWALQAA